jgi:cellulose synthase/poly-beta-1,6-N-acetylglucosamine synthase-like glycosyltransferase
MKVSCIFPAYNEAKNISQPLKIASNCDLIDEIIVVDDGSTDDTALIVKEKYPQVRLIRHKQNLGKADALITGAKATQNEILFFFDADLTGLNTELLHKLISPLIEKKVRMVIGVPEYMNTLKQGKKNVKIGNFAQSISGQKVLLKKDFLQIHNLKSSGYGVERKIANYYRKQNWQFKYIIMKGVGHVHKIKKWGIKGVIMEIKAFATFFRQLLTGYTS